MQRHDGPAGAHAVLSMLLASPSPLRLLQARLWARNRVDLAMRWLGETPAERA